MMERPKILVADDDPLTRKLLDKTLSPAGYEVVKTESGAEALDRARGHLFDAALVDVRMPGMNGLDLLRALKAHDPAIEVIVMTAHPEVATAVEALKAGAYDYLSKPLNLEELRTRMRHVVEQRYLRREVSALRTQLGEHLALEELVGPSPAMEEVKATVARVAPTDSAVLIEGESGTGKELVAAAIHRLSARSRGPFIPVNCGAIPAELVESEFFGHVRGAFSGAVADTLGLFRSAHGGTIFLDEVTELPAGLQTKLLRVLQEKEIRPVGATKTHPVDVRVVAATNRVVEQAVRDGILRQDLYYRLNVVCVALPPLRERKPDIPALTAHFIRRLNERFGRKVAGLAPDAMAALTAYAFPGNVRELENLLERAYALGATGEITLTDLPALAPSVAEPSDGVLPTLENALAPVERELILRALRIHQDDREQAARALGISPRTLYRRLKEHGIR